MRGPDLIRLFVLSLCGLLGEAGCASNVAPIDGGDLGNDAGLDGGIDAGEFIPPRVCRAGTGWTPGTPAFIDATDAWGLQGLNLRTFAVIDVDHDGFPDFVAPGPVSTVFLNRAFSDGGRRMVEQTDTDFFATRDGGDGRNASLATIGDVNNDGLDDGFIDAMDYTSPPTPPVTDGPDIVLAAGAGKFALTATPQILGPVKPLVVGSLFFDHNLDGNLDLAIGYWWIQPPFTQPFGQQPQLFRGDGRGGFTDVTTQAGWTLLYTNASVLAGTNARPLFGITMCDVNDDGRMDVVGSAYGRYFNELFVADGDQFHEEARARGVAADDRLDYTDDDSYRCWCLAHATDAYCAGALPPKYQGICPAFGGMYGRGWQPGYSDQAWNLGGNSFTHVCEDFDNDGDFDLYETNIRHPDTGSASDPSELLINDGTGHYARPGRATMGLTPPIDLLRIDEGGQQGAGFDFDNDGRLDIYLMGSPYPGNRGWLFHQKVPGPGPDGGVLPSPQFEYAGDNSGAHHPCPSGMALADFDHDGDEDLIVGTYGCNDATTGDFMPPTNQPTRFFENVSNQANWVSIRLVGQGGSGHANSTGLGARVKVTAGGVTQTRLIHGSWGQGGLSRELVAFFGLGGSCEIEKIEVRWPNATLTTQTFANPVANYRLELREGDPAVHYLP